MKSADLNKLSDSDIITQLTAFHTAIAVSPPAYGTNAGDVSTFLTAITDMSTSVSDLANKRMAVDGALMDRDEKRKTLVDLARALFRSARAKSGITDTELALAGLDPVESASPAPAPGTVPVAMIDYAKLRHTIRFRDAASPDSSKKPAGVLGCEIWVKLDGDPPSDEKECTFVALDTATPYVANYSGAEGGKKAHYILRWVNTRGEKGPWSEVVTATINA